MKKKSTFIILVLLIGTSSWAQSKEQRRIEEEGRKLYRSEMASWYGTDVFLEKFKDKGSRAAGYFSYAGDRKTICVFFSNDPAPKILATFAFDSTFNVNTVAIDGQERELSKQEADLLAIRQIAMAELRRDTLFKFYQDMNPNIIPLSDENGKRVYILTGPQKQGVVVFGNDYLLTFDKANKLKHTKRIHHNLIVVSYDKGDQTDATAMHSHLPETGDMITPTDICTLMLYEKFAKWKTHMVVSHNNISLWDCKKDRLTVLTKEAWEKISKNQTKP